MKSRRILCLLMTVAIALSMLISGCRTAKQTESAEEKKTETKTEALAEKAAEEPVEITFWNLFGGGEGDFVDQIVKGFNDSQKDVVVKALRLESNEFYAKLGTALSSGKGPDITVVHADKIAPFIKAKQLAELDTPAAKVGFDYSKEITDSNAEMVMYDGKHYAVPLDTHFHMFYFNKDLLKKAGKLNEDGTPNFGDMSPEGFKKYLQDIKDKMPEAIPFVINTPYFHEPFLNLYYEAGGDLLNADMTKASINNDKALKVLKFYIDLYDSKLADINDKTPWQTFHDGKAANWFGGVWEAGWHFGEAKLPAAAVTLPPIFGSPNHWGSSHSLAIPAYVDEVKQEAAMKFAKYFSVTGGQTWAQAGHVPAGKGVASSEEYMKLPFRKAFIEGQKTVKFAPKTDKYNSIMTVLGEHLQTIIFKKVTPEEGLANMEKAINEILAN